MINGDSELLSAAIWAAAPRTVRALQVPQDLYTAGFCAALQQWHILPRHKIVVGIPTFWGLHKTAGWVRCNYVPRKRRSDAAPDAKTTYIIEMQISVGQTRRVTAQQFNVFANGLTPPDVLRTLWPIELYGGESEYTEQ